MSTSGHCLLLFVVVGVAACPAPEPPPHDACTDGTDASLDFEVDFLDLDSGEVDATIDGEPPDASWDLRVAYSADVVPHGFLIHNVDAGVVLTTTSADCFYDVSLSDEGDLRADFLEEALPAISSVIIRTTEGRVFALGDAHDDVSDTSFAERFRFRELTDQ